MATRGWLLEHIRNNIWQYLIIISIFGLGLGFGEVKATILGGGTRGHLLQLINQFIESGVYSVGGKDLLLEIISSQGKMVGLMWFLGLTVIGVPLILGLVFVRAFSLGFTLGFLVKEKGKLGLLMVFASVCPQNLLYVPMLLIGAVLSLNFSLYIASGRFRTGTGLWKNFVYYSCLMLMVGGVFVLGALVECYFVPWLLTMILS